MICDGCATVNKHDKIVLCTKCRGNVREMTNADGNSGYGVAHKRKEFDRFMNAYATPIIDRKHEAEKEEVVKALDSLKLRERKTVEREMKANNVRYSHTIKKFVYTGAEEQEYELKHKEDSDGFPSDDNMSDQEDDN